MKKPLLSSFQLIDSRTSSASSSVAACTTMLVCLACPKHTHLHPDHVPPANPAPSPPNNSSSTPPIKSFTTQLKDIVMKFSSGAYRHCRPCSSAHHDHNAPDDRSVCSIDDGSEASSDLSPTGVHRFGDFSPTRYELLPTLPTRHRSRSYISRRDMQFAAAMASKSSTEIDLEQSPGQERRSWVDDPLTDMSWSKEMMQPGNADEWVAQVEPGVMMTFVALPDGSNRIKRIRFSRELFSKWRAQQWWGENCDMVHELYSVRRCNNIEDQPCDSPASSTPSRQEDALRNTPEVLSRANSRENSPARMILEEYLISNAVYETCERGGGKDNNASNGSTASQQDEDNKNEELNGITTEALNLRKLQQEATTTTTICLGAEEEAEQQEEWHCEDDDDEPTMQQAILRLSNNSSSCSLSKMRLQPLIQLDPFANQPTCL